MGEWGGGSYGERGGGEAGAGAAGQCRGCSTGGRRATEVAGTGGEGGTAKVVARSAASCPASEAGSGEGCEEG